MSPTNTLAYFAPVGSDEEEKRSLILPPEVAAFPVSKKEEESDELLGVKAVSELLGLAINTIHKKAYRKELPHMKRGKFLYFKRSEIMEYLNRGKVLSNDELEELARKKLKGK